MKKLLITLALSTLFLTACSSEQSLVNSTKNTASTHQDYIGKATAPIEMSFQLSKKTFSVGENIEVEISFDSKIKKSITTKLSESKNLQQLSSNNNWNLAFNKSGDRQAPEKLTFMAEQEGRFYLDFVASIEVDGKLMHKAFSIPIQVGQVTTQNVDGVVTDETGKKVKVYKLKENN